jgi:glycosyltransferase involved in cell wall biosynthesis
MRILSTADICVDPDPSNAYNDRSTMVKMAEYMALGKPVVAFDLPEHRHTAGAAAVYATPNDEFDFARKLDDLMDDPGERHRMGDFGRSRVETELAWRHQEARLVAAYDDLLFSRVGGVGSQGEVGG